MSSISVSVTAVLSTFCVIAAGFFLRRKGVLSKESDRGMMNVATNVLVPCLILDRILPSDVFSDPTNLFYPPLLGFGMVAFGVLLAYSVRYLPVCATSLDSKKKLGTFAACAGIYNYGYVPIPLVQLLFGNDDPTMAVLFVQNIGVEFALWTVGLLVMSGRFSRHSWKQAVNGPTITILAAVPLNLVVHNRLLPETVFKLLEYCAFVKEAVHLLGLSAIPLSMLLVGATIGEHFRLDRYKNHFTSALRVSFWSSLIRLCVMPILMLAVAVSLPCSLELKRVIVLHAAMGSAVFPIVMSQHYGGDPGTALDTVLSNSMLSIVTIPLWVSFGLSRIGS